MLVVKNNIPVARRLKQPIITSPRNKFGKKALKVPPCPSTMSSTLFGAYEIASKFKGIVLDQYGVLHNGHEPYPGAVELVERLYKHGIKIVIVSNSSRRSSQVRTSLTKYGFKPEWFADFVTSGELTHRYLATRPTEEWKKLGRRCVHVTWSQRPISIEGLDLEIVTDAAAADFILVHGTDGLAMPPSADGSSGLREMSLGEIALWMKNAASLPGGAVPLILANPDIVTVTPSGELQEMPGFIAQVYADAGGPVRKMGKPDPVIYRAAVEALGLPPSEIIGVGDSLEHDIAGANAAGINSLFIAGGIHAGEVLSSCPEASRPSGGAAGAYVVNVEALDNLYRKFKAAPTFVTPYFSA